MNIATLALFLGGALFFVVVCGAPGAETYVGAKGVDAAVVTFVGGPATSCGTLRGDCGERCGPGVARGGGVGGAAARRSYAEV